MKRIILFNLSGFANSLFSRKLDRRSVERQRPQRRSSPSRLFVPFNHLQHGQSIVIGIYKYQQVYEMTSYFLTLILFTLVGRYNHLLHILAWRSEQKKIICFFIINSKMWISVDQDRDRILKIFRDCLDF